MSRLRDLGFALWDPIGLLGPGEIWDHKPFAVEYDGYLRAAASMLRAGETEAAVMRYLVDIETRHMGLDQNPEDARLRARRLVTAISSDDRVWTSDD